MPHGESGGMREDEGRWQWGMGMNPDRVVGSESDALGRVFYSKAGISSLHYWDAPHTPIAGQRLHRVIFLCANLTIRKGRSPLRSFLSYYR